MLHSRKYIDLHSNDIDCTVSFIIFIHIRIHVLACLYIYHVKGAHDSRKSSGSCCTNNDVSNRLKQIMHVLYAPKKHASLG